ncbi:MAG: leucine-rich repeat protein [Lachnospiraceae bacterium]|nr:leucine-rich repeat protein [Lachnospiraceae bacterium]
MKKTIRNLIGILLLATAVAVTQIPVSDVEAVDTSSASDFQMDGTTLVKYNGTAQDVSISNYVEKIESGAFADNDYIRHVTIGDYVEVIGSGAFAGCKNLESVTIPDSVKTIENAAFARCPSLSQVTVGTGLSELGNGAFAGDYSLQNVRFNSSNPKFTCDEGAIYNKNGWDTLYQVLAGRKNDTYTMPSSVEKIKPYAFWGNYNLQTVRIGSQVKEISAYAFSNCKNLKNVEISYSVKNIDIKAFEDCVRLREIKIPLSVGTIHSTAFDGCTKLNIKAEPGSAAYNFAQTLVLDDIEVSEYEEAPIPSKTSVSANDVSDAAEVPQITAPVDYYHEVSHMNAMEEEEDSSVKGKTRVIGREAFVLIDNAQASVNVGSTGEVLGGSTPEIDIPQYTDTVPGLAGSDDAKGGSFPKYTVVNNSVIAAQAYYDDDMIAYEIPDGIVRLGEFSFARSNLRSVRIPDGVEEIGYAAFYHCDELAEVIIPDSVKEIGAAAFMQTPWLKSWEQGGSDYLIVGDGILLAYKGSDSVVSVPSQVKRIGAAAFKDCSTITKVIIPDSVEIIGEAAFENCRNLTQVEGGNYVREIRDRAFAGCPIATVHIPASVEKIGLRAFDSTDSNMSANSGVIVFGGNSLPELSYETTSTKVYRDNYRDLALKGSMVAVIPEGVNDLTGTLLADGKAGFNGVICKMTKAADGGNGTLQIVGKQGEGSFPSAGESCVIDGATYVLEDGAEKVLETSSAREEVYQGIDVRVNSYSLPQDGISSAVMAGSEENYILTIQDNEEAKTQIGDVYKKLYGNSLPHNLCAYEINLTDAATGIPITGLGKQSVEVTIPIPKGVGEDNLHVVCLDADGQLEEVESRIVSSDGLDALTFSAKHFSYYGIYNYGSNNTVVSDVKDGQAVFTSLGNKDDSPNTGDNSIHPKWFLCVGLVCSAMAVFFYRGGRRKAKY